MAIDISKKLKIARKNLILFRHARDMSQEELALQSGIVQSQLSLLERGKRRLKLDQVLPLAEALGIDIADLFTKVSDEDEAKLIIKFHKLRLNKSSVKNWNAIMDLINASNIE